MSAWNSDDPVAEQAWCMERRMEIIAYLQREGLEHGRVGESPAWHVAPYVSIWAIESIAVRDAVGWWAICGDLPSDYVSSADAKTPREAASQIAQAWLEAAAQMSAGAEPVGMTIGNLERGPELGLLLRARAELLLSWTQDENRWAEQAP